jgi:hypothetical protein
MRRPFSVLTVFLLTLPLLAQPREGCGPPRELLRRATDDLLRDDRLRSVVGSRARIMRVACEEAEKDTARAVAVAYVVGYETGVAAAVTFSPADFRAIDVRKLPGRPQSSEEERDEARALIRETTRVPEGHVIEGGFVVDPPPGRPPGRYLQFFIAPRARYVRKQEVIADLTRRTVIPGRTIEVKR